MNANNVTTGVRRSLGGVYRAPIGTDLPTDATTALGAAFKDQGYISEDGVTKSYSIDTQEIREWGGTLVHNLQTNKDITVQFQELETLNIDAIKAVYGENNVTGTLETGIAVTENDDQPEEAVWVIDMVCLDGTLERSVYPRAVISNMGDQVFKRDEAVAYDITLSALADSSNNKAYTYFAAAESE